MATIPSKWRNGGIGIYCVFLFPLASSFSKHFRDQSNDGLNLLFSLVYCVISLLIIHVTVIWSRPVDNLNQRRATNPDRDSCTASNKPTGRRPLAGYSVEDIVGISVVIFLLLFSGNLSEHVLDTVYKEWQNTSISWILFTVVLLGFIQMYIPYSMPGSFTLGEAAVCSQILAHFICKCMEAFILNGKGICSQTEWIVASRDPSTEDVEYFIEVSVFSCLLVIFLAYCIPMLRNFILYYMLIFSVIGLVSLPVLNCLLQRNFVVWLYLYISTDKTRTLLFFYWCFCFIVAAIVVCLNNPHVRTILNSLACKLWSVKQVDINSKKTDNDPISAKSETNINTVRGMKSAVRKQFHILAVVIFLPGVMYDVEITGLAIACALQIFIMIEGLRVLEIPPMGYILKEYLHVFVDDQDEGHILLTPMYLLAGCGVPLLIAPSQAYSHLGLYSGLISVGVGDTAASLIGSKLGRTKWPGIHKSIEGTVASIVAQFIFVWLLSLLSVPMVNARTLILAVVGSSFIEAYTTQIDNIILPFAFFILISI